jgi:2-amino-4-hydroxy-6-hydroxymethyldihydropteridine diphosphokinase
MDHTVYLALGSNLGNRRAKLRATIGLLPPQMAVKQKSPIYETPPWGYTDQPPFLNQVVKVLTYMEPLPLLKHLKRLERVLGREQTFENGPRLIDIDILFYDDLAIENQEMTLPHPRLHERAFVLVPLADIAPDLVHPVLGKTVTELLQAVDTTGIEPFK